MIRNLDAWIIERLNMGWGIEKIALTAEKDEIASRSSVYQHYAKLREFGGGKWQ